MSPRTNGHVYIYIYMLACADELACLAKQLGNNLYVRKGDDLRKGTRLRKGTHLRKGDYLRMGMICQCMIY